MKGRNLQGIILSVVLLLLVISPGLAGEPQDLGSSGLTLTDASLAVNARWSNIEVDTLGDTGQHTSLSVDPFTGVPHVSYYDATYKDLRVAWFIGAGGDCGPGNTWKCRTVDSDGDVGKYNAIAVILGAIHIAYYDASNGDLKYAESTDPPYHVTWRTNTVDKAIFPSSTGLHISVQLPYVSKLSIAYHFSNPDNVDQLRYAVYVGGQGNCGYGAHEAKWQCDTIQTGEGVGQYTSLALDSNGKKHIAYYDATDGDLWYATSGSGTNCGPGGNTWTCYPVTGGTIDVGRYASMYVDNGSKFHIAYYDATHHELKYAVNVGSGGNCGVFGSAQCDTIDEMYVDVYPLGISIVEDSAGYPLIAYQSYFGSLNVARPLAALGLPASAGNCGPEELFYTWFCETINPFNPWVPARHGDYVSIDISSAGLATIAYQGFITSSGGNLMISYQRFQDFLPLLRKDQ